MSFSIFNNLRTAQAKVTIGLFVFYLLSCSDAGNFNQQMSISEKEILEQLDVPVNDLHDQFAQNWKSRKVKHNFILDLEHGYCETAGSRIHLFADSTNRWAIVFEKSGYFNRSTSAGIDLDYFGNCIDYPIEKTETETYLTNSNRVFLIEPDEYRRIENKDGKEDVENFELIGKDIKEIKVRDKVVPFDNDYKNYEKLGIVVRDYSNPNKLIGFGDLIRFYHETNPSLIAATENDIRQHIPKDLPKLMTIEEFHFSSIYNKGILPSQQELYQLIARILVTRDTSNWKPTQEPNNSWKNWESENL